MSDKSPTAPPGNTPLEKIAGLWIKREDLNPSGSVKDRAVYQQIRRAVKQKYRSLVISSTGNAAISASYYARPYRLKLYFFLSPKIEKSKYRQIISSKAEIKISPTPVRDSLRFARKINAYHLRQSSDPFAWKGYQSLGREIAKISPLPSAVFFPLGSGATLYGVWLGLKKKKINIPLFAVQPAAHAPIAAYFSKNSKPEKINPTPALSVKFHPLKEKLLDCLKKSRGGGYVIAYRDFKKTKSKFSLSHPQIGKETLLAITAAEKYRRQYPDKKILVIATGKKR